MKSKYPKWIDEFADAFYSSFQHHDVRAHMPFNGWDFYPLFADFLIQKIDTALTRIQDKQLKIPEIIEKLPNHASMRFVFSEISLCLKTAKASNSTVQRIGDFFARVLALSVNDDKDNPWISNKVRIFENVNRLVREKKFAKATKMHAQEIGKIIAGCATLGHGLYNDFCVDITYDVYGPYDTSHIFGKGTCLIIRSFPDLSPTLLWPRRKFLHTSINIYTIYKNIHSESTFVPCQMLYRENLHEHLTHFAVEIDGKFVTELADLEAIRKPLLKMASELYADYLSLGFEKQKRFWLYQFGYQLKKLFDLAGMDWRPSGEIIKRVRDRNLIPTIKSYNIPRAEFYKKFGVNYLKQAYKHVG